MAKKQLSQELNQSLKAFLRIKHPSIDPDDITHALGLQPEHAVRAGTDVSGSGVRRLHSESYWLASVEMESRDEFIRGIRERALASKKGELLLSPELNIETVRALAGVTSIFEVQLIQLATRLKGRSEFLARLANEGGRVSLLIQQSGSQEAITLSPLLMRSLADLGISVEID